MQEHIALLRTITISFPAVYPDLALLTSEDAEVDFFNNIAHLQLHRRSRALLRLSKVRFCNHAVHDFSGYKPQEPWHVPRCIHSLW